jgi:hypothetical protein
MPEATNNPTTPTPLNEGYVPVTDPSVTVRFRIPLKDRCSHRTVTGTLRGVMYMRGEVHHYRVAGSDGVFYLVPVAWFMASHVEYFHACAFAPRKEDQRGGWCPEADAALQHLLAIRSRKPLEPVV